MKLKCRIYLSQRFHENFVTWLLNNNFTPKCFFILLRSFQICNETFLSMEIQNSNDHAQLNDSERPKKIESKSVKK